MPTSPKAIQSIKWDGKQISKPGLYGGISLEQYHDAQICVGTSVSSSGLRKIFNDSPAHFFCEWAGNPKRVEPEDKPHFAVGRAVHHLMLGEPFFAKLFAVKPAELPHFETGVLRAWHGNNLECKDWLAARKKEGKGILSPSDVVGLRGMAESLGQHPFIKNQALNGLIERSGFYKDKETGIWVKIRPDAIPTDSGDYTDLKTTTSVKWEDLRKVIAERGYHQQLALIRTVMRELGFPFSSATLIFVEKKPPYATRVVTVKDNHLDLGARCNRMALEAMADCLKAGRWPGPGGDREDAEQIELPEWAANRAEDRLKYGIPS